MNSSDSFELLINQIAKDLSDINDRLALIGIVYLGKVLVKTISKSIYAIKSYLIPMIFPNENWIESIGNWAIITGCSNCVGYGYAVELAKRNKNLILIEKNKIVLDEISEHLVSKYKIEIIKLELDLNYPDSFDSIEKSIIGRDIGILVNANYVSREPDYFHLTSKNYLNQSILSNITEIVLLTRMVLPAMVQKNKGAIVYTSTANSLLPSPYNSLLGASNKYVEKFFESLQYEYSDKKIYFQCLNTGFINYNDEKSKLLSSYAIRTLGWSKYTFGYSLTALKFAVLNLLPISLFNFLYSKIQSIHFRNYKYKSR